MMNGWTLFQTRLQQNLKHQYAHLKTIFDWTVIVYLVLPAIIIFSFIYQSWWVEIPVWMIGIPFPIIFVLAFLFAWRGDFQTFVREADRVFLMKRESLLLSMKRAGILYSYIIQLLPAVFIALLIAPFWFQYYQQTTLELILFIGLFLSFRWLIMAIKGKMNVHIRGWRQLVRTVPFFIGAILLWELCYRTFQAETLFLSLAPIVAMTVLSYFLTRPRYQTNQTFERDLAIDEMVKNKYSGLILSFSMDIEKMPKITTPRTRPRLYSKSNRLFKKRTPQNGFLELFIKVTTRSTEYIFGYLKIAGVTTAAIFALPPIWLKIMIALFGLIFLMVWVGNVWDKVIGYHSFTKRFAQHEAYFTARKKMTTVLVIPFILYLCLSFAVQQWLEQFFQY